MERNIPSLVKSVFGETARRIYRNLPISDAAKVGLKDLVYGSFGFLVRNTPSYRHWHAHSLVRLTPIVLAKHTIVRILAKCVCSNHGGLVRALVTLGKAARYAFVIYVFN